MAGNPLGAGGQALDWREAKARESLKSKILNALVNLHEALPLTTAAFKEAFSRMTGCEFEFDVYATAKTVLDVTNDVTLAKYAKTINTAYCGDKSYIVELGNVIEVQRETIVEKGAVQETWIANFEIRNVYKEK
jgi:hypothetical protein